MILSGMMLRNVGTGIAIRGLQAAWSTKIRAAALAIIFLRSGLEIDLEVRRSPGSAFPLHCSAASAPVLTAPGRRAQI